MSGPLMSDAARGAAGGGGDDGSRWAARDGAFEVQAQLLQQKCGAEKDGRVICNDLNY